MMEQNQQNLLNTEEKATEIDLMEIARLYLKKWWLILLVAVVAMVGAIGYTKLRITPMYQSKAMLYILTESTSVTDISNLQIGTAITGDFAIIATSKPAIDRAIQEIEAKEGITLTRGEVLGMISVENPEDTRILTIKATSSNPEYACMVANAVSNATAERVDEIIQKGQPPVVERAEVSTGPISPNVRRNAVIGFVIGAFAVCAVLLIQHLLNDHIKTEEDVEKYLGAVTLVSIPYIKNRGNKAEELRQQKGESREQR